MRVRWLLLACLVFSGLSALVYQVLWTRLLGFAFGTTTEAIGTVLAVFFGGMALGNWLAARRLDRVRRPLRVYALLELGIGVFALVSLPALEHLHVFYGWLPADPGPLALTLLRVLASAAVLLPPTIAMGATLPVVAHGLVDQDTSLGRWSALLYTANTLGAVLGAYLCGFWMIPFLGLATTVLCAAAVNVAVAGAVLAGARGHSVEPAPPLRSPADPAAEAADDPALGGLTRGWYLAFFGLSGFVAIGYEIIWSKVFTIVMEGTLYGFSTVLSAYLLGLALGSLAISSRVDRIRDLPRAFGLLHIGIGVSVALGIAVVSDLPHWHFRLSSAESAEIHRLYLIAAPIILLPTMLFGAAFPVLIRLYARQAATVGRGFGLATAVNTAGSIAASLAVGFWSIEAIGIDATLYLLLMVELAVGLGVLLRFQVHRGRERLATVLPAVAVTGLVAGLYNGVQVDRAVSGRWIGGDSLEEYRQLLDRKSEHTELVIEGKTSVVTVHAGTRGWNLQNNGMPEAGFTYAPPYRSLETLLLGALPYLQAEGSERALVIGFGGGSTLDGLLRTEVGSIAVVELEQGVVDAIPVLYRGRRNPLDDPRVEVRVNDGRNELLRGIYEERPGYDLIASQPSHPWLAGAANLFTREFFELARESLHPGGVFSVWVNGFHTDAEALMAVLRAFEEVFPGSMLVNGGLREPPSSFLLIGSPTPLRLDLARMRARMAEPALREELALHGIERIEDLLARIEGPCAAIAAAWPGPVNSDDNAIVETRLSRIRSWAQIDYAPLEARLSPETPVLPPIDGDFDLGRVLAPFLPDLESGRAPSYRPKAGRLLAAHGERLDPVRRNLLEAELEALRAEPEEPGALAPFERLAAAHPERPEPWRARGRHAALRTRDRGEAARAFEEAWQRSGEPRDAVAAARAWWRLDRSRVASWLARLSDVEEEEAPLLALYRADAALRRGAGPRELELRYQALLRFRDSERGRATRGVAATLSRLARALGDDEAARAFGDLDWRERNRRAEAAIARARQALGTRDLAGAREALEEGRALVPGDFRVTELAIHLALAAQDPAALKQAFEELRTFAPDFHSAVATENRLRARLQLPLLPQRPAETLMGGHGEDGPPAG